MTKRSPFRYFRTRLEIISPAVMMYVRFPLSLRHLEDSYTGDQRATSGLGSTR